MQRRRFLQMGGAALLGGGVLSACGGDAMNSGRLGVQLFTLRNELQADARRVLADIAAIGYREIELFGFGEQAMAANPLFGLSAREFRSAMDEHGLSAPVAHIDGNAMNIAELADLTQELGTRHLVVAMAPEFVSFENGEFQMLGVTGRGQIDGIAERLNRQGELARAAGIGFGYHNHDMEFTRLEDDNAFDYLFAQTDAELVKIELDIGWAIVAGVDPIDILARYGDRVIAVHLKDYDPSRAPGADPAIFPVPTQAQLVEPGAGPTDFGPILARLDETGVQHRFVEIDASPDPLAAIANGHAYLANR